MQNGIASGWVYCMSNVAMPGLVKVGYTEVDPYTRAKELQSTGVPFDFNVEFARYVSNCTEKEHLLHMLLEKHFERPNKKREFFRCSSQDVYMFFQLLEGPWLSNADSPDPLDLRKFAHVAKPKESKPAQQAKTWLVKSFNSTKTETENIEKWNTKKLEKHITIVESLKSNKS